MRTLITMDTGGGRAMDMWHEGGMRLGWECEHCSRAAHRMVGGRATREQGSHIVHCPAVTAFSPSVRPRVGGFGAVSAAAERSRHVARMLTALQLPHSLPLQIASSSSSSWSSSPLSHPTPVILQMATAVATAMMLMNQAAAWLDPYI